jgi:competence protein ComEC
MALVARVPTKDPEFEKFAATIKNVGVGIQEIGAGDSLAFNDVRLDVLWPPANADPTAPYGNDDGVVLRLRYRESTVLFAADIEKRAEAAVLAAGYDLSSDVVKVAHHGSRTSSTAAFVSATHPAFAIISVGRTSIFGHPHPEVVERWRAGGARVMTTGEKGTISVVSDGRSLTVTTFVP